MLEAFQGRQGSRLLRHQSSRSLQAEYITDCGDCWKSGSRRMLLICWQRPGVHTVFLLQWPRLLPYSTTTL